ncbi:MAG TPA: hypothetical protein VFJ22_15655 [Dermatophilaceae bacterium]|jgi:hypothetical protein|nr:hypothetical protein [Dermatophilaceae bacterium]
MTTRRRIAATMGAAAAVFALTTAPAFAGSAHFIGNLTSASISGMDLKVDFKEAGLESGSVETITAAAHLDATYQCINGGANNPSDAKKTTVSAEVSQSGQFTAGKNGNVVGSLLVSAPSAASVLDCPSGQTSTLTQVVYSNVTVTDETSGAFLSIPGTFSAGAKVGHGNQ